MYALIHDSITIIIDAIADFGCAGVNIGIGIIAVIVVADISWWQGASQCRVIRITETISIRVCIVGVLNGIIDDSITVIVDSIADFGCTGVNIGIGIIAVIVVADKSYRRVACQN